MPPHIWYPPGTRSPGYPSVSTRLGRFGPPIEVICLLCSSAHLSSCLWSTNVDKSSSIWLPRSRYCRTIQKNTCAATARSLVTARSLWSSHRSNLPALWLSCLWNANVDKSSSIWLPRSRYCRTIHECNQKRILVQLL